ncbi:hypothetical protein TIFTF001_023477, partial [Ficus carica]
MRHLTNMSLLLLSIVLVLAMIMRPIEAARFLSDDLRSTILERGSDTPSAPNLPD